MPKLQENLDHAEQAAQVDLYLACDIYQIAVLIEIQVAHDASITDQDIHCRKLLKHLIAQDHYRSGIADVALQDMDVWQRPSRGIELLLIASSDDDGIAALEQLCRQLQPDLTRAACDQDRLGLQIHLYSTIHIVNYRLTWTEGFDPILLSA